MAKTQDLRRRIRSITNTRQLTRAMKTVSAAKLRRAQERITNARPYAEQMRRVLSSLATRANPESHPLLGDRGDQRVEIAVISSDRGQCGSFNANICRTSVSFLEQNREKDPVVMTIGKKGREFFKHRSYRTGHQWADLFRDLNYLTAAEIGQFLIQRFLDGEVDAIYLGYNQFKSTMSQTPVIERVLPIERGAIAEGEAADDYIYEPDAVSLFNELLPKHVEIQVYRALLESQAAEHAARMTAMDAATRNAGELIDKLTLHMNRVRQASITTEIIEVVSGAQALG